MSAALAARPLRLDKGLRLAALLRRAAAIIDRDEGPHSVSGVLERHELVIKCRCLIVARAAQVQRERGFEVPISLAQG